MRSLPDEVSQELREYYARVVNGRTIVLLPPADGIKFYNGGGAIVLHREGQFQCELMFSQRDIEVAAHRHPHVESLDIMISGDVYAERNGVMEVSPKPPRPNGVAHDFMRPHPFPLNSLHAGAAGARGGCVLMVQRWLHGVKPTSVTDDQGDLDAI